MGERERGRGGDGGTGGQGVKVISFLVSLSPRPPPSPPPPPPVSPPCPPVSPSPPLPVSPSPPLSSQPISTHFESLSLYLIALTIRLLKISPTLAWSARTVGSGRGRRISTPLSRNRGAIISSVSLTTSSRATSCMTRSA